MTKILTYVTRGKIVESVHLSKCIIKDYNYKTIFSSNHDNNLVYPRSAIKIFQALPFDGSRIRNHIASPLSRALATRPPNVFESPSVRYVRCHAVPVRAFPSTRRFVLFPLVASWESEFLTVTSRDLRLVLGGRCPNLASWPQSHDR